MTEDFDPDDLSCPVDCVGDCDDCPYYVYDMNEVWNRSDEVEEKQLAEYERNRY